MAGDGDDATFDRKDRTTGPARTVRDAFDQLPIGLASLAEPHGHLESANAAFREFAGRDDIIGQLPQVVLPAEVRGDVLRMCDRVRQSRQVEPPTRLRITSGRSHQDAATRWVNVTVMPVFDDDEALTHLSILVDFAAKAPEQDQAASDTGQDLTLQDAHLPSGVAVLPRVDLAATYLAGSQRHGGDWFDSIPLDDGRVAVVVGDVPGHGVASVAAMGQLRSVLDAALRRTRDASRALEELDAFAARVPDARAASMVVAVLDAPAQELRYCTAGHPPPLLVPAEGEASYLPATGGGTLGSGLGFPEVRHALSPGDVVLLYSDGLLDRAGPPRARGSVKFASAAVDLRDARPSPASESVVDRMVWQLPERLLRHTGSGDDITLLAAQVLRPPVEPLSLDVPARTESLLQVRKELNDWLEPLRLSSMDAMALHQATGELVANSIEHAHPGSAAPDARVRVAALVRDDGEVRVEVSDDGVWRESEARTSPSTSRGRGLNLARLLTQDLLVIAGPDGTTVRLSFSPARPVHLYTAAQTVVGLRAPSPYRAQERPGWIRLSGPVDVDCADELRHTLGRASQGATRDLVVDLTEATALDSTALQVLLDMQLACRDNGRDLELRAPAGSVAQLILETARLPYR